VATTAINSIRTRREAIVNAHIEAEAVNHDVAATVATFRYPRYEVPALGAIVDGADQCGTWAGIDPTGKRMEVQGVLIFVFEGDDLVCEKVYFDHATILRQLGVIA
jgi:hypothetical protein